MNVNYTCPTVVHIRMQNIKGRKYEVSLERTKLLTVLVCYKIVLYQKYIYIMYGV